MKRAVRGFTLTSDQLARRKFCRHEAQILDVLGHAIRRRDRKLARACIAMLRDLRAREAARLNI